MLNEYYPKGSSAIKEPSGSSIREDLCTECDDFGINNCIICPYGREKDLKVYNEQILESQE